MLRIEFQTVRAKKKITRPISCVWNATGQLIPTHVFIKFMTCNITLLNIMLDRSEHFLTLHYNEIHEFQTFRFNYIMSIYLTLINIYSVLFGHALAHWVAELFPNEKIPLKKVLFKPVFKLKHPIRKK